MENLEIVKPSDYDVRLYCLVDPSHNVLDIFFEGETASEALNDYTDDEGYCSVRVVVVNVSSAIRFLFGE